MHSCDYELILQSSAIYMIRQSIDKVAKLLRDRNYSVPEFLYKFYSFALYFAQRLDVQSAEYNAIALFAQVHRLYKAYLVDQPYKLNKLSIPSIALEIEGVEEFEKLRERFMNEFPILMPKESFFREVIAEAGNCGWAKRLQPLLLESLEIKKELEKKKAEGVKHSQLTVLFWYRQFKGDYLVHIDTFIESFASFTKQYLPVLSFISNFSIHCLKELADPEHKHFVTIINCEELLLKLRDPAILQRLWQETQQSREEEPFKSLQKLHLSLILVSDSSVIEKIEATGEKVKSDSVDKLLQKKHVIFVGSAVDNDIVIKSKYVSRKQLMIIQDRKHQKSKEKDADSRCFSAVCLSQTNFTSVKHPKPFKLHIGDIFYCGKVKYQLLRMQKQSMEVPNEEEEEEDERTLTMLPAERESPTKASGCERATFIILSGQDKEKQFSLSSQQLGKLTEIDQKHEFALSKLLLFQDHFFLKPGARVLLKNANEILENRLSRKTRLVKGMQICLQEFSLMVQ